ncbi:hypothetical protein [Trichothermofontia sp.]
MNTLEAPRHADFACRHCQSYSPEGRRGGHCQLLNVAVQGCWRACSLGALSFTPDVERRSQPALWSDVGHPRLVEAGTHDLVSTTVFTSPAAIRGTPVGITRLRETVADPSAA